MAASYHESYWVAAAAAAPVIILGFLLMLAAGTRIYLRGIQVVTGPSRPVERRGTQSVARWAVFVVAAAVFAVVITAVLLTTIAFVDSLNSLTRERDAASPSRTTEHLVFGLVALLIWTALAELFAVAGKTDLGRRVARWVKRASPRPKPLPP